MPSRTDFLGGVEVTTNDIVLPARRRASHILGAFALAVLAAVSAAPARAADFADIVAAHSPSDHDGDGTDEIESLAPLFADELAKPTPNGIRLVVVLVEKRLLATIPGSPYSANDLVSVLNRYRDDLRAQGYVSRTLVADVFSDVSHNARHQDGRTVLALRALLQETRASYPQLQGAVLVGNFPEAMIVRSVPRRINDKDIEGKDNTRLLIRPEVVARRSDLVLADLDGRWEQRYEAKGTELRELNLNYAKAAPGNPGEWPCQGCRVRGERRNYSSNPVDIDDYFYVQDDIYFTSEQGDQVEITLAEMRAGLELAPGDFAAANPIARPEIVVSRINPSMSPSSQIPTSATPRARPTWMRPAAPRPSIGPTATPSIGRAARTSSAAC
jgi:hypothetical protein